MSLVQTVDLEQIVDNTSPAIISRWVAAHNPVYLEWIRKDTLVTGITLYEITPGVFRTELTVASNTGYSIDDLIYVNLTNGAFASEVVTVVALNGSTGIVISKNYGSPIPSPSGYINNLTTRKNYYIELELTDSAGSTQLALLQATPDTTGKIGIDISGALQSYLTNEEGFDIITQNTFADTNAAIQFKYRTKEYWTGSSESFSSLSALHYGVNGAFQIGHTYNGNYVEYYPEYINANAKFITDFEENSGWHGYPLDIAFLYNTDLDDTSGGLTINYEFYDYNDQLISSPSGSVPDTDVNNLVRIKTEVLDVITFTEVKYFLVWLSDDNGQVTEKFKTNVKKIANITQDGRVPFECDGIYLQWLGEKGNRSYFWFNDKYQESLQVDGGGTYQKAFDGIDNLTERANWYEKKPFKKLTLGAQDLTRIEIEGLKSLLKSTKVNVVDPDTFQLTGVLLEPGTFQIGRGDDNKFRIEFTIVFPEQFNQTA